jgi:hypothetical protein
MVDTMNGWTNYQTWNVYLWIANNPYQYAQAKCSRNFESFRDYMSRKIRYVSTGKFVSPHPYTKTPDGVSLTDPELNIAELDRAIAAIT